VFGADHLFEAPFPAHIDRFHSCHFTG
jgi:hypothetical protein